MTGKVAKNMIKTFFFDLQKLNAGASRPKDVPAWRPEKVGDPRSRHDGQPASRTSPRSAGIPCVLKDVSKAKAEQGKAYSARLVGEGRGQGRITKSVAEETLRALDATEDAADLAGCDMIIEAVFEDRELKAKVTREAEARALAGALICSNTSTLPITGLAKAVEEAGKLHRASLLFACRQDAARRDHRRQGDERRRRSLALSISC